MADRRDEGGQRNPFLNKDDSAPPRPPPSERRTTDLDNTTHLSASALDEVLAELDLPEFNPFTSRNSSGPVSQTESNAANGREYENVDAIHNPFAASANDSAPPPILRQLKPTGIDSSNPFDDVPSLPPKHKKSSHARSASHGGDLDFLQEANPFVNRKTKPQVAPISGYRTPPGTSSSALGNPFMNPFASQPQSPTISDTDDINSAASEYYRTLTLLSSASANFDEDESDDDYEQMLSVFMRENQRREPITDIANTEELYGEVSDIGGLTYMTSYPMAKMTKVIVSENVATEDAQARLAGGVPGSYFIRSEVGTEAIILSMIDRVGKFYHIPIESFDGAKFNIPPSTYFAPSLEELVMHYVSENQNDVLPCHLTFHLAHDSKSSHDSVTIDDDDINNVILGDIPNEFQSRQSTLLFSGDYDSPRCLRCGKRFTGIRAAKRFICHCCGVAVCSDCSSERLVHSPHVRLCSQCYENNKDNAGIKTALRPVPVLVVAGNLTKSDKKKRSWQERFFTLDSNGLLHYYKFKKERRAKRPSYSNLGSKVDHSMNLDEGNNADVADSGSNNTIGDVAGTVNIKDNCTRILANPQINEFPKDSLPETRFAVCTNDRTFYFFAKTIGFARKWRGVLTLTAECCFACGEKLFSDGEDGLCVAASSCGLLFHTKCYSCYECRKNDDNISDSSSRPESRRSSVNSRTSTETHQNILEGSRLHLKGDNLLCSAHCSAAIKDRKLNESDDLVIKDLNYKLFPLDELRDYTAERFRKYARLAASATQRLKKKADEEPQSVAKAPFLSQPKAFGKISHDERLRLMYQVKIGEITVEHAVKMIQESRSDAMRNAAALAMSRCAAHGVNIIIKELRLPTNLSESWEHNDNAMIAKWSVVKSDEWIASNESRSGAIPFNVVAFQPQMFAQIRSTAGINEGDYLSSFSPTEINKSNMISGGSSGCWVVRTHDSKYIIKNCRGDEKDVLLKILPEYTYYLERNPSSLLCRYLGAYEFRMDGKSFVAVVMTNSMYNSYCAEQKLKFHEVYDLKGSIVGRRSVKASMRSSTEAVESFSGTMKDMDLRRTLTLPPTDRQFVVTQMESDANFLKGLQLMDYSLIVALHNCDRESTPIHEQGIAMHNSIGFSNPGYVGKGRDHNCKTIYVFGIIDLLQKWGRTKVAENFAKSKVLGHDRHAISAVKPHEYAERFITMLSGRFDDLKAYTQST